MRISQMVRAISVLAIVFLSSCYQDKSSITNPKDYDRFLRSDRNQALVDANKDIAFWSERLRPDSTGVGDLVPLANSYTTLFVRTGNINYLKDAEVLLDKAYSLSSLDKDFYGRSLAHNYIAQHRFKDAFHLLDKIYNGISNKRKTGLMLFDVCLELGRYDRAYQLLNEIENKEDFDYLIRMVKWNDHKGNSEAAIRTMERAKSIAESRGDKTLITWTYNSLATLYGHSERIEESYHYFLKSLEIQPDQVVPKKGIAWIIYSHEKNALEANRILDSIMIQHNSPDLLLFRSELAYYNSEIEKAEKYREDFIDRVENNDDYGLMYQKDMIEIYAVKDPGESIKLARIELENRSTPLVYSLLAYAHLGNNDIERSIQILEDHVQGRTFEPIALYFSAWIFHKSGRIDMLEDLRVKIEEAQFELGPLRIKELFNSIRND